MTQKIPNQCRNCDLTDDHFQSGACPRCTSTWIRLGDRCANCESKLNDEEVRSPRLDGDGDPICDECYMVEYQTSCEFCEEYYDLSGRGAVGSLLVVLDARSASVDCQGVYQIKEHPYWTSNYFDGWLDKTAVELVSESVPDVCSDYAVAHFCPECERKWREAASES